MEAKVTRSGDEFVIRIPAEIGRRHGFRDGQSVEVKRRIPSITLEEMVAEAKRLGPAYEPETVDWGPDRGSEIIDDDDPR